MITLVALYDCDVPLNASADTSEPETKSEPETEATTDPELWKNPPLAEDQSLPHGLRLLPGHALIANTEQKQAKDSQTSFVVKVPNTSAHDMW